MHPHARGPVSYLFGHIGKSIFSMRGSALSLYGFGPPVTGRNCFDFPIETNGFEEELPGTAEFPEIPDAHISRRIRARVVELDAHGSSRNHGSEL